MDREPSRRELLEAAAKRAADKQPDAIRLIAAPQHAWSNASAVGAYATSVRALGFAEAGTYTVDVLPVAIRFLLKASDRMYATIYEHPKVGVWMNFVVLYEDGTSATFTTTRDRGLEKRPGHPIAYSPGATAERLYAIATREPGSSAARKELSPSSIVAEFEKAWADGVLWRKTRGFSMTEVASVLLSRDGRPGRVLRPQRIQFIAEQDGAPERTLKASLAEIFDRDRSVEKAYLARVQYDGASEIAVALCLVSAKPTNAPLVDGIRKAFARLFETGAQLDIMFVATADQPRLERVSTPFYTRGAEAPTTSSS